MWPVLGIALATALAATAWWRARMGSGYYDGELYGMTPAGHRRYAAAGLVLACACVAALLWQPLAIPALAMVVIAVILYAASFARGAADEL
jgi:hypothetical protein